MTTPRFSTFIALVALAGAAAAAGYVWYELRSGVDHEVGTLRTEAGVRGSELAALGARVDELANSRRSLDAELDGLRSRIADQGDVVGDLPERVGKLEHDVDRFIGVGDKVRSAWLLSEAEHYMRIANAQLGLAGDVDVAQIALGLADDSLRELNEPRMLPVRKLLAGEINALKAVPRPDTEGIVLSLGSLADNLDNLPLKNPVRDSFQGQPEQPAAPLTGFARAMAAARAALASLVSIRHVDDPVSPLLSEAQQTVLVRSLDLELQLAQLAIMRGDAGMFQRSVEAAVMRLRENFDAASPEVQSAIETLNSLATTNLPDQLPDISGSLAALVRIIGPAEVNEADNKKSRP